MIPTSREPAPGRRRASPNRLARRALTGPQGELIGLADQLGAEAVVWLLSDEPEAARQVDAAGSGQRMVGPQLHPRVAGLASEIDRSVDQLPADSVAARSPIHEQYAQLRDVRLVADDAEDAPGALAVDFGDPRLLTGVASAGVI